MWWRFELTELKVGANHGAVGGVTQKNLGETMGADRPVDTKPQHRLGGAAVRERGEPFCFLRR